MFAAVVMKASTSRQRVALVRVCHLPEIFICTSVRASARIRFTGAA